jgi:hypothetical protein
VAKTTAEATDTQATEIARPFKVLDDALLVTEQKLLPATIWPRSHCHRLPSPTSLQLPLGDDGARSWGLLASISPASMTAKSRRSAAAASAKGGSGLRSLRSLSVYEAMRASANGMK